MLRSLQFVVWLMVSLVAIGWAEPPAAPSMTVLQVVPPRGDCLRYQVGWLRPRLRSDYVHFTIVWQGDTLAKRILWSELIPTMVSREVPDTAHIKLSLAVVRYEQRLDGRVTRGPVEVKDFDIDRLLQADQRARFRDADTWPAPPLLVRQSAR